MDESSPRSAVGSRLAKLAPFLAAIVVVWYGLSSATLAKRDRWQSAAIPAVLALGWTLSILSMRSIEGYRSRGERVPKRATLSQWLPLIAAAEIAAFLSVTAGGAIVFQISAFFWAALLAHAIRQTGPGSTA